MNGTAAALELKFRSWWLSGTGGGRGRHLDAVCHRDVHGLPAMPMSQVKGTLRETAERLADAGRAGWRDDLVTRLFGSRTEEKGQGFRTEEEGQSSEGAVAFLGDAEMSANDRKDLTGVEPPARERREALYRRIAATRIDDRGAAADRTLRYVEAAAPVKLIGRLEWVASDPPDIDWIALLDAACAATLAFGKLKLDGYGTAIASAIPNVFQGRPHRVRQPIRQRTPGPPAADPDPAGGFQPKRRHRGRPRNSGRADRRITARLGGCHQRIRQLFRPVPGIP